MFLAKPKTIGVILKTKWHVDERLCGFIRICISLHVRVPHPQLTNRVFNLRKNNTQ
jgi:hypothetical protein